MRLEKILHTIVLFSPETACILSECYLDIKCEWHAIRNFRDMSHLTLTEVLEMVWDDDGASEPESEGDELSGADFLCHTDDGDHILGCCKQKLIQVDLREDPCYRSSLLLLDPSLLEVIVRKLAV